MRWLLVAAAVLLSATGGKQTETHRDVTGVGVAPVLTAAPSLVDVDGVTDDASSRLIDLSPPP